MCAPHYALSGRLDSSNASSLLDIVEVVCILWTNFFFKFNVWGLRAWFIICGLLVRKGSCLRDFNWISEVVLAQSSAVVED